MPGERLDPAVGYRFDVRVDEFPLGLFTRLEGLGAQYETEEVKEGGENTFVHVLRGRLKFSTLKLTRPVDRSSGNLAAWFTSADHRLSPRLSNGSVSAYDAAGNEVARWNLVGVFPVRYTGPSFQSGSASVLTESVELAHHGFTTGRGSGPAAAAGAPGGTAGGRGPAPSAGLRY